MDLLMELLCTALTVTYASNPYTVLLLPKGDCHLCCPYHRDDVKLYMSIPGGPHLAYFDWENSSDWRLLDNNRTVVFYIHGFTEQYTGPAATAVSNAYKERGEDNVVLVDWSILAAAPWYPSAVANTQHVATILAAIIDSLVIRGLPLEKIHVIGFSLGAEIAGLLAKKLTVGKLKRITGLDPALPLYDPLNPRGRLAKTDAEFVDVIHTDGGFFGFESPIGHADFFPNGGKPAQPGCMVETLVHTGKLNEFVACSHNRAWMFYAESVRDPLAFPSYKCHTFLEFEKGKCQPKGPPGYMGYLADPRLRGKYFLDTKSSKPYGLGLHQNSVSVNYEVNIQHPVPSGTSTAVQVPGVYDVPSIIGPENHPIHSSPLIGGDTLPSHGQTYYQQEPSHSVIGHAGQQAYSPAEVYGQPSPLYQQALFRTLNYKGPHQVDKTRDRDMKTFVHSGTRAVSMEPKTLPGTSDYLYSHNMYPYPGLGTGNSFYDYQYTDYGDYPMDYSRLGRGVKYHHLKWRNSMDKLKKKHYGHYKKLYL